MMKILVNQRNDGAFIVGQNQFINVAPVEIPAEDNDKTKQMFSVGIENVCFGLYKRQNDALIVLNAVIEFLKDDGKTDYRLPPDNEGGAVKMCI